MIAPRAIVILGIVAVISIAVNLFLAGSIVGHGFRPPPGPPPIEARFDMLSRDLPPEDQKVVQEILDRHREDIMAKWHALRGTPNDVSEAFRADPFVPADAQAAFARSNARFTAFRDAIQEAAIEIASRISPEGRKRLHFPGGGF